jgi:peptidoglycan/LPS O-acetylase OafA/YrhL
VKKRNPGRIYAFDNAKAIASIMGVLYHVSLIFTTSWAINIDEKYYHDGLLQFIQYTNAGRMPIFLFIAGFFACYNIKKYSRNKFLFRRVQRILLPFIFGALIIIPFQAYWVAKFNFHEVSSFGLLEFFRYYANKPFNFAHLWFLYYIYLFSLLLFFGKKFIPPRIKKVTLEIFKKVHQNLPTTIVVWAFIIYCTHFAGKLVSGYLPFYSIWFDVEDIALRLPLFAMGSLAFLHKDIFIKKVIAQNVNAIIFTGITFLSMALLHLFFSFPGDWFLFQIIKVTQLFLILAFFYRLLNFTNPLLKYISDASYPFYILHHLVVIVLGYFYLGFFYTRSGSVILDFAILSTVAIFTTYMLYHILVKKSALGKFLFTGFLQKQVIFEGQVKVLFMKWIGLIPRVIEKKAHHR